MIIVLIVLGAVFLIPLLVAAEAGLLMVLLGALASVTGWPVAIGFWACVLVTVLWNLATAGIRTSKK